MKRILLLGFILLMGCDMRSITCSNSVSNMELKTDEAKVQAYAACMQGEISK